MSLLKLVILAAVCLAFCLVLASCIPTGAITACVATDDSAFHSSGVNVINPRIESTQTGAHRASALWIAEGEHIIAKWDRVNVFLTKKMEECHFESVTSFNENCRICDLCGGADQQLCRLGVAYDQNDPHNAFWLTLKVRRGLNADGELIDEESIKPSDSCLRPAFDTVPQETATYELFKPAAACENPNMPSAPLVSAPVHVIKAGTFERVKYQLERHGETNPAGCETPMDPTPCSKVWFRWTMPDNTVWSDSFSNNLIIGQVEISKFRNDGGRLTFVQRVRPSRIVIRSTFDENSTALNGEGNLDNDNNSCFAVPDSLLVGDQPYIDLCQCHLLSPNMTNFGSTQDVPALPTFFNNENRPTWFVEFNQIGLETAGVPMIERNENLFIEFTIQTACMP